MKAFDHVLIFDQDRDPMMMIPVLHIFSRIENRARPWDSHVSGVEGVLSNFRALPCLVAFGLNLDTAF